MGKLILSDSVRCFTSEYSPTSLSIKRTSDFLPRGTEVEIAEPAIKMKHNHAEVDVFPYRAAGAEGFLLATEVQLPPAKPRQGSSPQ